MNPSMESLCLSFRDIPQTSKIFSTFLEDFHRVGKYYGHSPSIGGVAAAAKEVEIDPSVRLGVVEVLREQNLKFGGAASLDAAIARNLDRLANGAVAIASADERNDTAFVTYEDFLQPATLYQVAVPSVHATPIKSLTQKLFGRD